MIGAPLVVGTAYKDMSRWEPSAGGFMDFAGILGS
jgi:hypothetical protein